MEQDLPIKYGRDHGLRITMGELAAKILSASGEKEFLDLLDSEFLFGCWKHEFEAARDPNFIRDIRGMFLQFYRVVHSHETIQEFRARIARNLDPDNVRRFYEIHKRNKAK